MHKSFPPAAVALIVLLAGAPAPAARASDSALFLPLALRSAAPARSPPDRGAVFGLQISEARFRDPRIIADVRAAGATYWRTFVFWDEIEPARTSPPVYDWRGYDPLFQAADRLGLTVIAEVQGNPPWAAEFPGGPPRDFDALAGFVAAAA